MSADERRKRAEARRGRTTLRRATVQAREHDLNPIEGPEALSLVTLLTRESWSAAGLAYPTYSRSETPYRFVAGRRG